MALNNELPNFQSSKGGIQGQAHMVGSNLSGIRHVIAVSSGKGGVGKSTVSVNLAIALANQGFKVGLMDADVYGPSVPKMLDGLTSPEEINGRLQPVSRYNISFMSMGLLTNEESPVIWRGPMATKLIQTFLNQVEWGDLDYLLIDLPPGTGDVQLTLTQAAPLRGAIVVTTPQEVAVSVAMRGLRMFEEVKVPILGVIENMSGFVCTHCHHESEIFKKGGGEKTADRLGLPFLGRIPLDQSLAMAGDEGYPVMAQKNLTGPVVDAFNKIAEIIKVQSDIVAKETSEANVVASSIDEHHGDLIVNWSDDTRTVFNQKKLRFNCACARCVDEVTHVRTIKETDIPDSIKALSFKPIGRYGIQISWSDGHSTGIYTFNRLREIGSL